MIRTYNSPLGNIYFGPVEDGLRRIISELLNSSIFILADENTASLCVPLLKDIVPENHIIIIPAGEQHKNLDSCQIIWSSLVTHGADRDSIILNVGGGMICDIGGFAASCYQRGIRFGHIPTSVLAMADAALGGKTSINFKGFKNYLGSFRSPGFIWIDEKFLETLPRLEKISGLAEIVKHAVIASKDLFDFLSRIDSVEQVPWREVLEKNFPIKMDITEADPLENGVRKILNFGHTIGHGLESYFLNSSQPLTHGQCIALGMLVESKISNDLGLLNNIDFKAIVKVVDRLLEPVSIPIPTFSALKEWVTMDKKKKGGEVGFSLPDKIGSCGWGIPVEDQVIARSLDWLTYEKVLTKRLGVEE